MKRAERAQRIHQILDDLYPTQPIPLTHSDPYTLLIAVLLSAQTTDARVNIVTPALFDRARTPAEMVTLTVDEIRAFIRSVGLAPAKARNIHRLSELLLERQCASWAWRQRTPGLQEEQAEPKTAMHRRVRARQPR